MIEIVTSEQFDAWMRQLRDARARARIQARILRLSLGNPGDVKPVGKGVSEMRIDYGPGYRVYYLHHGAEIIVLLCGGDKSNQQNDIALAQDIAAAWKGSTL
jgi:putative addiction module killer protein